MTQGIFCYLATVLMVVSAVPLNREIDHGEAERINGIGQFGQYNFETAFEETQANQDHAEMKKMAEQYLTFYHYLGKRNHDSTSPTDASLFKKALINLQAMGNIPQTGELDIATQELMKMPRCGVADDIDVSTSKRGKRYVHQGSKWGRTSLTYRIDNYTPDLPRSTTDRVIKKAFQVWSQYTILSFQQIYRGTPDISISFVVGEHGDGMPFNDGPRGILAHAFYPEFGGDIHFDEAGKFTTQSDQGINLFQVAAHEIGHSLGLSHSKNNKALMAPKYRGFMRDFQLNIDDIEGINNLYGHPRNVHIAPRPTSVPTAPPREATTTKETTATEKTTTTDGTTVPKETTTTEKTTTTDETTAPKKTTATEKTTTTDGTTTTEETTGADPNYCSDGRFDDIIMLGNKVTYGFRGRYYYKIVSSGIEPGYPKLISEGWKNLPDNIDAAVSFPVYSVSGTHRTYADDDIWFFKGSHIYKYNRDGEPTSQPKSISSAIRGLPDNVDSAFVWSGNSLTYITKGNKYYRLNRGRDAVESGYPEFISEWAIYSTEAQKQQLSRGIDAAFEYSDGRTYFFQGQNYYRFNDQSYKVDTNYPRLISGTWYGCRSSNIRLEAKDGADDAEDTFDTIAGKDVQNAGNKSSTNFTITSLALVLAMSLLVTIL